MDTFVDVKNFKVTEYKNLCLRVTNFKSVSCEE